MARSNIWHCCICCSSIFTSGTNGFWTGTIIAWTGTICIELVQYVLSQFNFHQSVFYQLSEKGLFFFGVWLKNRGLAFLGFLKKNKLTNLLIKKKYIWFMSSPTALSSPLIYHPPNIILPYTTSPPTPRIHTTSPSTFTTLNFFFTIVITGIWTHNLWISIPLSYPLRHTSNRCKFGNICFTYSLFLGPRPLSLIPKLITNSCMCTKYNIRLVSQNKGFTKLWML